MGTGSSAEILDQNDTSERYLGLKNYGNTCYCNSVIQALYFCLPFREQVLQYTYSNRDSIRQKNLIGSICRLFSQMSRFNRRYGVIEPRDFVSRVKRNVMFEGKEQHDAHEFLTFLLNDLDETLKQKKASENGEDKEIRSFIQDTFEGILSNETKCLGCENITTREESFLNLSIDIERNSSVTSCLKSFCSTEYLRGSNKFYCDICCGLQEAKKRMHIKKLPKVLVIHLKRFKYIERLARFAKLSHRINFPFDIRLSGYTTPETEDPERAYNLFAVVTHIGLYYCLKMYY
eukprot:TRINITY_DN3802_c0_g1_i1.p1 TRINITY_DN3802_c0_g1~~TRINITY_DN3802_c0_g1_i1.p1  ORF type:complete len:290 (-),score=25.32 TRINITY_DN3802_c0_g1_i1:285-1154(-)